MRPRPLTPPKKRRRSRRKQLILSLTIIVVAAGYTVFAVSKPFSQLQPSVTASTLSITTSASNLPWPAYGQGAYGLSNGKVIATHGEQTQVAIASAAKVITALVILERHPLTADAAGPTITLTDQDAQLYKDYIAIQGSVMPVRSGQKLTERQMLEALLLPSANNIADSLAIWSFGSVESYLTYANAYLQKQGLTNTRVGGDASGYLPDSVSTASDLVKLGGLAMQHATVADIVAQKTAVIPEVGTVRNVNSLLDSNGIVGVKTGNNDQNGGVFIGATTAQVNGKTVTIISALAGAPTLGTVLRDSASLLAAVRTTFAETTIVKQGSVMGTYTQEDGGAPLQAVVVKDVNAPVLRGDTVKAKVALQSISHTAVAGQTVGYVIVPASDVSAEHRVPIVLKQAPTMPSLKYRLLHP